MAIERFATFPELQSDIDAFARAESALILADYDGVVARIVPRPEDAIITPTARQVIEGLVATPQTAYVNISGRDRDFMDQQFAGLPVEMSAEHGCFRKTKDGLWVQVLSLDEETYAAADALLTEAQADIPGSHIERKEVGLGLHYREATIDPESAYDRAKRLHDALIKLNTLHPLRAIDGSKVVEVQPAGASKGESAQHWLRSGLFDVVIGLGDDTTDEDLMRAIQASDIPVKQTYGVGGKDIGASKQLADPDQVLELYRRLASARLDHALSAK